MSQSIIIRQPDDFHAHLRQGEMLKNVIKFHNIFGRVLAMGNLTPAVSIADDILNYKKEILACNPSFEPIMSLMLVNKTTPETLKEAHQAGAKVLKLIPGGTSTNSDEGVRLENIKQYYPVLEAARDLNIVFSIHAELDKNEKGENIPEINREEAAILLVKKIIKDFPRLKIVIEHTTTKAMIDFVKNAGDNVAATITVHHPFLTTEDVLAENGEIKNPFFYCKPILKSKINQKAAVEAMTSGNPKFFFGSDSAPHPQEKKLAALPAAGIFSAPVALPVLAQIFSEHNALQKLENFTSRFGAEFYELDLNKKEIEIKKESWLIPDNYQNLVPFLAGKKLEWKINN